MSSPFGVCPLCGGKGIRKSYTGRPYPCPCRTVNIPQGPFTIAVPPVSLVLAGIDAPTKEAHP